MWILLLVGIGIGVYLLVQAICSRRMPDRTDDTPLEILEKRYARGEITKDEFERMRHSL